MNSTVLATFAAAALATAANMARAVPLADGSVPAARENAVDEAAIRSLMSSYEAALNASDTHAVMPLYADDGVFMPPYTQSAVGKAAVREAYEKVFKTITLSVKFHVVEVVQMAPFWAFARTNSTGAVTVHATGATSAEGNQELFIFRKGAEGTWKIARYSFAPTDPPRK